MSPQALSVPDAAAYLGISKTQLYALVRAGRVGGAKRFGRSVRISKVWLDGFLASSCERLEDYSNALDHLSLTR